MRFMCSLEGLRPSGHDTFVASRFRSYDLGLADRPRQRRLAGIGCTARRAAHVQKTPGICQFAPTRPELWFTITSITRRLIGWARGHMRARHPLCHRRGFRDPETAVRALGPRSWRCGEGVRAG